MKKNIIITGASSGLGKEIGKKFLKEKYNIINISRRMSKNFDSYQCDLHDYNQVLKTIKKVQRLGNIAIILITHNEIHARLIADRFTFLSLGEVIGTGLSSELGSDDVKRLMAGGAEIGDLAKELELS